MKSLCESSVFFHASWKDVFLDIYSRPIAFAKFPSPGMEISFLMGSILWNRLQLHMEDTKGCQYAIRHWALGVGRSASTENCHSNG